MPITQQLNSGCLSKINEKGLCNSVYGNIIQSTPQRKQSKEPLTGQWTDKNCGVFKQQNTTQK